MTPPMATPRVAAGVLVRGRAGAVLMVQPTYKDGWDIPGGYVEPGESPRAACLREIGEELGVALPVGRLLVVDWAPHPAEGDKLLFVFDAGRLDDVAGLRPDGVEVAEVRFWQVKDLDGLAPDRLVRRVRLAARMAATGGQAYAEHGAEVGPDHPNGRC